MSARPVAWLVRFTGDDERGDLNRRILWTIARAFSFLSLVLFISGCGKDPERHIASAQTHLAAARDREAAIELRNAVAVAPDHPQGNFLLGKLLAKVGSLVDAEIVLLQALKSGHPAAEVVPVLGQVMIEAEKYSVLLKTLDAIEAAGDQTFAGRLALLRGRAYVGLGRLLEARTQITLASATMPTEARLALADLSIATGDWAGAARELDSVTASDPRNADAWIATGMLLRRLGKDDEALQAFGKALAAEPEQPVALLSQAIVYLTRDDLDAAKPFLDKAGKIAPLKPMLEFANGLLALKEKRNEDARAALQRLLEAVPTYRPALLLAGALNYATERYDLAENSYAAYLRSDSNNAYARKMLAATLIAKGRSDAALEVIGPAISQTRDPEILILSGRANLALGRVQRARAHLEEATKVAPDNADARLNLAFVHLVSGRRNAAASEFEAALKLRSDDARANRAYCMMLLADGRIDLAARAARAFLDRAPKSPDAHTLVGAVELARKNDAGARSSFEQALTLNPSFIPAAEALADIDQRAGVPDALKKRLDAVLAADPKNLDALLIRARVELDSGGGEQSAARVRELLTQHPKSLRALLLLAESQLKAGQATEAITTARRAAEEHPWDTSALYLLADAQLASGDAAGAIVTLERAVVLAPGRLESHIRVVSAHVRSGDLRTAISKLNALARVDRSSVPVKLMLGQAYLASKRSDDAMAIAKELQKSAPKHHGGYALEGETALVTGAPDRAAQAFSKAEALFPNGEHKVQLHRARTLAAGKLAPLDDLREWLVRFPADRDVRIYFADALLGGERYSDAIEQYRILHKESPQDPRVLNNLAWSELKLARDGGALVALDYAQQAAKLRPDDARVLDTLGVALLRSKREAEAVQTLLKAQSINRENPEIGLHLGEALIAVGDVARGRSELSRLLSSSTPAHVRIAASALLAKHSAVVR